MFTIQQLTPSQIASRQRIIETCFSNQLSHIGTSLSTVDLIDAIYSVKEKDERFVLSNGHAGIALYVVLEKYGFLPKGKINELFIHPDRNNSFGIDVSTGSLGQGLPIALGMALANRKKNVYCVTSDGESAEGSIWEALRIGAEQRVNNLKIVMNVNGWKAYDPISSSILLKQLKGFGYKPVQVNGHNMRDLTTVLSQTNSKTPLLVFAKTTVEQLPFLKGLSAHYYKMTEQDYQVALEELGCHNQPIAMA